MLHTHHALEDALRECIRGDVSFDPHVLGIYATDASIFQIHPVGLVVPRDEADVVAAVALAVEHGVSILPRGGGTSLAGQAVGNSLILDFSKYMNGILELNVEARQVRVQPGLVRDELNAMLEPHGLHFGPDPATTSRANIGGMVANNSSGTRSLVYGKTVDHVVAARVLLADGTILDMRPLTPAARHALAAGESREAEIYRGLAQIAEDSREAVRQHFPKVMRRVGGYGLDLLTDSDDWNLAMLFAGSEGTLGVLLDVTLDLTPLPAHTALCVAHYRDVQTALGAVAAVLEHGPSAVEILDKAVIDLARGSRTTAALCGFLVDDPGALLIIECLGDTEADVHRQIDVLVDDLKARGEAYAYPALLGAEEQAAVWAVRKDGLGLLQGMKTARKPQAFIEDACVPIDMLPEYMARLYALCDAEGITMTMYAHVSVGVIHTRPVLDLHDPQDVERMKRIAHSTMLMVREYGGSWSGEHGDGLARSPFNEEFFGPELYAAFKRIKALFDPQNLMNPGKIVDAPPLGEHLRYAPPYAVPEMETFYHYRGDGGFAAAVELCSGVGQCRKTLVGTMCPSYIATRDEEHSTRGRANALRLAMSGQLGPDGMHGERLFETLDLCLSCKACKKECPSNVDMARLRGEFLQRYHDAHGVKLRERLVAASPRMAAFLSGAPAPIVNAVQSSRPVRLLLERLLGISSKRILPPYAAKPLKPWLRARTDKALRSDRKVALFADTYMNYHEPSVGRSAVELLESCGYEVVIANVGCCQRPRISHGFLRDAKRDGLKTLQGLDTFIRQGMTVVVCEPGCASALTDDLPDLIDDEALANRIKSGVMMIDTFLAQEIETGRLECSFEALVDAILLHGHCHQKALFGTSGMTGLLRGAGGVDVREVDAGCCGMAGSFGYEHEHYALSEKIAEDRLLPAIREAEATRTIVASGFSCRHQIEHFSGRRAVHWVEVIRGIMR